LPSLTIPAPYRRGIEALAGLSDSAFSDLLSALGRAPALTTAKELTAWLILEVKDSNAIEIEKIVEAISSLYRIRIRYEVSASSLATDVVNAVNTSGNNLQEPERFKIRLEKLLVQDALNTASAKAVELRTEYERIYHESRVMTDLRPVFGGNVEDAPAAMLIVHTLKMSYYEDVSKRPHEIYVTLDSDDIRELKKVLDRAELKEQSLKKKLESAGIRSVDLPYGKKGRNEPN
jgi:hypothetical protein